MNVQVRYLLRTVCSTLIFSIGCASQPQSIEVNSVWGNHGVSLPPQTVVAVLEPQVDVVLHRIVDDPRELLNEEEELRVRISASLRRALADDGIQLASTYMLPSPEESRFQVARLLHNHATLVARRSGRGLPDLGPGVNVLSEPLEADILLVSRYRGWRKTTEQWRKERVAAGLQTVASLGAHRSTTLPQFGELEMIMIDGVNGRVWWRGTVVGNPEAIVDAIPDALSAL